MVARSRSLKIKTKEIIESGEDDFVKSPQGFFWKYFSFKSKIAQRIYIFVFAVALVAAMLAYNYTPDIGIELGVQSPRTIKANKDIQFEDAVKTAEDKDKNEAQVENVFVYDPEVLNGKEGVLYQIKYFFLLSQTVQLKQDKTSEEKVSYLTNLLGSSYPESAIKEVLNLNISANNLLLAETLRLAREIMNEKIQPTQVDFVKNEIPSVVRRDEDTDYLHKTFITTIIQTNLKPTAAFDSAATEKAKLDARLKTPPHMINIVEGQTIVPEGEIVQENQIIILKKLGLMDTKINWTRYIYISLVVLLMMLMLGVYIFKFESIIYKNTRKVLIIVLFIVLFTGIMKGLNILANVHLNLWNYFFPVIAISMLITIIFDSGLGIMVTICMAFFAGVVTNLDFSLTIAYLIGGIFSTFLVSNISQRSAVMRGGFFSAMILGFLFFTINFYSGQAANIVLYSFIGILNGIICAVITIGLMPFVESAFKVVTAMGLLELSHTDQPVLKEMFIKAPGTYNHSLLVSHLSENAAKAIGADYMLAKVAALYHDIGKLRRPEYFYENQVNVENVHDKLNPSMSKNIISSHIRDGIEDSIKNKIPRKVIQVISQHHGTSLMNYFYEKHKDRDTIRTSNGNSELIESHFRYQTRKPQSKEAAILMLADSVEAAVRSIEEITPKKIEQMVNYIIDNKIKDGQLNEADITLKDINAIKQNLVDGLISLHHSRISYPGTDLKLVDNK